MILYGSKPFIKQYLHDPQVTKIAWFYLFNSFAIYGRLLFLNLSVLHLNSFTFICLLLVLTSFRAGVKKECLLLTFLYAKVVHSFSRLSANVVVFNFLHAHS